MPQPPEMKGEKTRKLVFFTYGTMGTLGDPSASAKLIKRMKEQYGASLDITVVLVTDKNKEATERLFDDLDITFLSKGRGDLNFFSEDSVELVKVLAGAEGILFFPNSFIT